MAQSYQQLREEAKGLLLKSCFRMSFTRHKQLLDFPESHSQKHILLTNMGISLFFQDKPAQACQYYLLAVKESPLYLKARYRLMETLLTLHRWDSLCQHYNDFLKANRGKSLEQVQNIVGQMLLQLKQFPTKARSCSLYPRIVAELAVRPNGYQLLAKELFCEISSQNALTLLNAFVTHKFRIEDDRVFNLLEPRLEQPAIALSLQFQPYQSKESAKFLKKVAARVDALVTGNKLALLSLSKGLRASNVPASTLQGFYEGVMLRADALFRVKQYDLFVSELIRLLHQSDSSYFSKEGLAQFTLQNLLVAKTLSFPVSDEFKREALTHRQYYPLLGQVINPFKAVLPCAPPESFQEQVHYFSLHVLCQNDWDRNCSNFLEQVGKFLDELNRDKGKKERADLYYCLALLCSRKQAMQTLYAWISQRKYPEFLRQQGQIVQHIIDVLLNPVKRPEHEIPEELRKLVGEETHINVPQEVKLQIVKYLPKMSPNPRSRKIVHSTLQAKEDLVPYFVGFIVEDSQPYPQFCRWAKDHDIDWRYQMAGVVRILKMAKQLTHQFDIFAGLLGVLRAKNCQEGCMSCLQQIKSLIFQENMYIVHAAMQIFNNLMAYDEKLKKETKVLQICCAYFKSLDLTSTRLPAKDFSHPAKIYPTVCSLVLQFATLPSNRQLIEKWGADLSPEGLRRRWQRLSDEDIGFLYRVGESTVLGEQLSGVGLEGRIKVRGCADQGSR